MVAQRAIVLEQETVISDLRAEARSRGGVSVTFCSFQPFVIFFSSVLRFVILCVRLPLPFTKADALRQRVEGLTTQLGNAEVCGLCAALLCFRIFAPLSPLPFSPDSFFILSKSRCQIRAREEGAQRARSDAAAASLVERLALSAASAQASAQVLSLSFECPFSVALACARVVLCQPRLSPAFAAFTTRIGPPGN